MFSCSVGRAVVLVEAVRFRVGCRVMVNHASKVAGAPLLVLVYGIGPHVVREFDCSALEGLGVVMQGTVYQACGRAYAVVDACRSLKDY